MRKVIPLSATQIAAAKPKEKPCKLFDGGGLFLLVTPAGGKLWRLKYNVDGKEKLLTLGAYPAVSLKDARQRRDEAKEQLAKGIDPGEAKKEAKAAAIAEARVAAATFKAISREWFDTYKNSWVDTHSEKIIRRLENYIFPLIGAKPVNAVTAPELLEALRRIEDNGAPDAAHRALQNCGRIFRYAIATGRAERDTAADLRGALSP
ncbi:MAG: integrase arm-type DNA-binding domain-containing protein, partial [Desulfovibrio sp.]|nr:integrase arm-type DNA-binding domain-containing protein [Desulfovibrio sp.]